MEGSSNEIIGKIHEFLNPGFWDKVSGLITSDEERALKIACDILDELKNKTPSESRTLQSQISKELKGAIGKQGDKVDHLKKAIQGDLPHWKDRFLSGLDVHFPYFTYSNSLDTPLNFEERFHFYENGEFFAHIGSTFFTNREHRKEEGNHILDSLCARKCYIGDKFNGYALTLGDGAGGHFGDESQDQRIAGASHFATKSSVTQLSSFTNPEELLKKLDEIIENLSAGMKKFKGEGTTLIACRLFPVEQGFRLIGFNLGDCLSVGWHPETKTVYPIFNAHASSAGSAHFHYPKIFKSFEMQKIDTVLPKGTAVFLMSDGIHEMHPCKKVEKEYENKLAYTIRSLLDLEKILDQANSGKDLIQKLIAKTFDLAEKTRQEEVALEKTRAKEAKGYVQKGDDCSLLLCQL